MKKLLYCALPFILIFALQDIIIASPPTAINNNTQNFTDAQIKQIEKIIHAYLINNPQILIETGKKLQEQELIQQKAQIATIKDNIPKYKNQIFDTRALGRIVLGNPQGKIIIAEFTQHQCSHCKSATKSVKKLLKADPEIQLIQIYWPFFGDDATYTTKAVLAAKKQNKGAELDQIIFAHQDLVTKDKADLIIKSKLVNGLDPAKLYSDMADKNFDSALNANFKLAEQLALIGTPTLIITNKEMTKFSLIPGQTTDFEADLIKAVDEVR